MYTQDDYTELILQYLYGSIAGDSFTRLNSWIRLDPANEKYFYTVRELWLASQVTDNPLKFDKAKGYKNFLREINKRLPEKKHSKSHTFYIAFARVAAIFIIAVSLGGLAYVLTDHYSLAGNKANNEFYVPYGSISQVKLPDGTTVDLNAGSKISYRTSFGKKNREVWLDGEGYFKVASDKKHSFIVHAGQIDIKAFGTEFNVKAYANDNETKTTLAEGSVGIYTGTGKNRQPVMLKPAQQATYDKKSGKIQVETVDVGLYRSWKDEIVYFENETFCNIAKIIERKFNVSIVIDSDGLKNEVLNGSIDSKMSVYQWLKGMGAYSGFTYKEKNDTIFIHRNN